jgi:hypothetical protein
MKRTFTLLSGLAVALLTGQIARGQPSDAVLKSCREQATQALKERTAGTPGNDAANTQVSEAGRHDPAEQAMVDQCVKNGGRLQVL